MTRKSNLIHFVYNGLTDSAILAALVAKRHNIPFVFTPNILDTSDQNHAWNSSRFKFLYKSASRIIALTAYEADWLESQNVPREKISVVPYGPILHGTADGDRFRTVTQLGDAKIILFLARIIPLKGYDLLLDACTQIWNVHPDSQVIFIGPATAETRETIISTADPRILLLENIDQNMKADAIAACDLLCVPSRKESLGVVYIEAAFNAKPVVALNLPVLREVVEHGTDGLLVEESASCIADAVISLLNHPKKAAQMGLSAQEKALKNYNWAKVSTQISNIYYETMKERKQRVRNHFPTLSRFARKLTALR